MPTQHVVDSPAPIIGFSETIPLHADALPLVETLEAVEARNAARARERDAATTA